MKATGDAAFTDFWCALAKWSDRTFSRGLLESTVLFWGSKGRHLGTSQQFHASWCPQLACGVTCIGSAGDEEGRCRGSSCNEEHEGDEGRVTSTDDRHFEICSKRMQAVQLLPMQVTKAISGAVSNVSLLAGATTLHYLLLVPMTLQYPSSTELGRRLMVEILPKSIAFILAFLMPCRCRRTYIMTCFLPSLFMTVGLSLPRKPAV